MLNGNAKLSDKIFTPDIPMAPTRDGFGKGTIEAAKKDPRVVVLCADLAESTRADWFQKEFPERFVEMGVAEQNMATVAAGMANYGKIPFIASYAAFSPGRNYEQIRTTIALNNVPVKVCGMHAGLQTGPDGATHQMLEDIGMMRMLPNMVVIVPGDAEEGRKAVVAAASNDKPTYLRFAREKMPVFTTPETPFEIGKAYYLWKPSAGKKADVAILGCGSLLYEALKAAKALEEKGVSVFVLNVHTIKPLDADTILSAVKEAGAVVTVEEHQAVGGFGAAIAEFLAERLPMPMEFVGVKDKFGQSGTAWELFKHYGVDADAIVSAAEKVLSRKQQ
jgi:transketolase